MISTLLNVALVLSLFFTNEDTIVVTTNNGVQIVIPPNSTFEVENVEYLVEDKIFILRQPIVFVDGFEETQ